MLIVTCECSQQMKVPDHALGKTGKCVSCSRRFRVSTENTRPCHAAESGDLDPRVPQATPHAPDYASPGEAIQETKEPVASERNRLPASGGPAAGRLIRAAAKGRLEEVRRFVARGVDVNVKSKLFKYTPLFEAAANGHTDVIEFLIANGADVNPTHDEGNPPPVFVAASNGHLLTVKALLGRGADPNARFRKCLNFTALHQAAGNGHTFIVKALLRGGANPNTVDIRGRTPLHWAAERGHAQVVEVLLESGADTRAKDSKGRTPLHRAARFSHGFGRCTDAVRLLLEHSRRME